MTTSAFGSYFIQMRAAMLRLCLGCVLCSLFFGMHAAHAAQSEADLFSTRPDLLAFQLERYDSMRLPAYRFDARIGIADTSGNVSGASRIGGTSGVPGFINLIKSPSWVASISWHMADDSDRASLAPYLRVESKETLVVIKPIQHSAWMIWHKKLD